MLAFWRRLRRRRTVTRCALNGTAALLAAGGFWAAAPLLPIGGGVLDHVAPEARMERAVALTFDDGPSPTTPTVLDILDGYGAKGTFFLVGQNTERLPSVAHMIVDRGHEVGNHSQTHSYLLPYMPPNAVAADYRRSAAAIQKATGVRPHLFRAPHGNLSPWMRWAIRHEGARIVGWDTSPQDWRDPDESDLVKRIATTVQPGSIILLHDGMDLSPDPDRRKLVQALPGIIEALQIQGYRLVTVSQLLRDAPYMEPNVAALTPPTPRPYG